MNAWRQDVASVKTQNGVFRLETVTSDVQTHHELSINGQVLASTGSQLEITLAEMVLAGIPAGQSYAEILIGGLGLGVTLKQVLKHKAVQSVCVVEVEPRIVEWNRTCLANGDLLDDKRIELVVGDFCSYVQGAPSNYHGIVMHIDVGPDDVARTENRQAYSLSMLRVLHTRLRAGGTLAICAGQATDTYERALQGIFSSVEIVVQNDTDRQHAIYQVMA